MLTSDSKKGLRMKEKYLVTGGSGFIGSNLIEKIISQGSDVVIVGKHPIIEHPENTSGIVKFYQGDVTDYDFMTELLVNEKFDYIILLAADISISNTVHHPLDTHLINEDAVLTTFEIIRKNNLKVRKVLFTSSSAVYGNLSSEPRSEKSPVCLENPYAIDKFSSERYALFYDAVYNIPTVVVRFFNVFGPRQRAYGKSSGVCAIILDCLLYDKEFFLYGDGRQTRDYLYVDDATDAMMLLLKSTEVKGEVFNVAAGQSVSLIDLIALFEKIMGKKLKIVQSAQKEFDAKDSLADISKINKISFKPKYSLESGLRQYIRIERKRLGLK